MEDARRSESDPSFDLPDMRSSCDILVLVTLNKRNAGQAENVDSPRHKEERISLA